MKLKFISGLARQFIGNKQLRAINNLSQRSTLIQSHMKKTTVHNRCNSPYVQGGTKSTHPGFTLTEMLIVIVIIVVLAALLFPLVSMIRGKAQASKCVANLRGWGIAIRSYANDHNGFVQHAKWASVGSTTRLYENDLGGDFEAKTRDLDGQKVYLQEIARRCPAQEKNSSVGYGFVRPQPHVSASSQPQGFNLASATDPGSLLLMIDTINNNGINLENKESLKTYVYPVCQGSDVRHSHNVNALFGDGHIGVYKWSEIDGDNAQEVARITKWFTLRP